MATIKGNVSYFFYGIGCYVFLFELNEDKDLISKSGSYFMGQRGMYLNIWTLDFDLEVDVPSTILVWVSFPHISMHC